MIKSIAEGAHLIRPHNAQRRQLATEFCLGYFGLVSAKDELRSMVRGLPLDLVGMYLLVGAIWSVEAVAG